MELQGIENLRTKLYYKRSRVLTRYKFYEMKNLTRDFGISTPPDLRYFTSTLGWCATAVDSLADRLRFREFDNDTFGIGEIYKMNNQDVLVDSTVLGALISSCDFIAVSKDADGYPILECIDGGNATGVIDPRTNLLYEGYAVLERDKHDKPIIEAYYIPYETQIYTNGVLTEVYKTPTKYPALIPIINRPDARRPFGRARISRACMSLVGGAVRCCKRSEIAAEFFAYPQKYVTGLSESAEIQDRWRATMSTLLTFTKDEDGDSPTLGQFAQQSFAPHLEQLKMFASLFAGECGLTLDDLGFPTANPSSAESIKAAHESLRLTASKAQSHFGTGLINAGFVAACIRDNRDYSRKEVAYTEAKWHPIFAPDFAALSSAGDSLIKIQQAFPDYLTADKLKDLIGV